MESSLGYFLLPQEVKEAFPREPDVQQGYVAPGREIFDQKEDGTKVAKKYTYSHHNRTYTSFAKCPLFNGYLEDQKVK